MSLYRACAALFALVTLAACGRAADQEASLDEPARLPPADVHFTDDPSLSPHERVRAAIEGYHLSYIWEGPPPHDVATGETFACAGQWQRMGGWGNQTGTYRIDADRVCIEGARTDTVCLGFVRREGDLVVLDDPERGEIAYRATRATYCAPDPEGGPSRDVGSIDVRNRESLNTAELRPLLRGSTLFTPLGGLATSQTFSCDGRWIAPPPQSDGRYRIRDNQVCIELGERRQCQRYYLVDGVYYSALAMSNGQAIRAQRFDFIEEGACSR